MSYRASPGHGAAWAFLLAGFAIARILAQTPPPQITGSLAGRVLDGATGQPIAGAEVMLDAQSQGGRSGGARAGRTTTTDGTGAFAFAGVAPGSHQVEATKTGYLRGFAGGMTASELFQRDTLQISPGEKRSGIVVRAWRGGAIAGHVRLASGGPLARMTVYAYRVTSSCGAERLIGTSVTTDDTGAYRFFDLVPGDYVIGITTVRGTTMASGVYPTTYFPGVVDPAAARALSVTGGQELSDIDVVVPGAGFSIKGRVAMADQSAASGKQRVDLWSGSAGPVVQSPVARTFTEPDGSFTFTPVPPGRYVVRIVEFPPVPSSGIQQFGGGAFKMKSSDLGNPLPPMTDAATWWGEAHVDVTDRNTETSVRLEEGWRIRGRVTFEAANGGPPPASYESMPVLTFRSDGADPGGTIQTGRVEQDGRFTTVALPPGRYVLSVLLSMPSPTPTITGLSLQAVRLGGRDVTGSSIEVNGSDVRDVTFVFTDRAPVIAGTVEGGSDLATFGARHYIFPTDERLWSDCGFGQTRFVTGSVGPDGRFRTRSVPPGEYFVTAAIGAEDYWITTDFLRSLVPFASRVKVALGDTPSVSLKARPRR